MYSVNFKLDLTNNIIFPILLIAVNFVFVDTPRHFYFLHTLTWMMNMFGIFFILAAHEHYSIDVFVAFYITSRLFLYYHTLSNNQALMQRDSNRTRVWFPLFSYFESSVDGIVPNEYNSLSEVIWELKDFVTSKFSAVRSYQLLVTQNNNSNVAIENTRNSINENKSKLS